MFGWGSKSGHITEADLSAYADGMVTPSLASRIETHIGACSECATALQELQATKTILATMPRPATQRSFTLGPEFASQRLTAPAPQRAPMRGMLSFAPALTLSILVVLLVIDLLPGGSGKSGGAVTSYDASGSAKSAAAAGPPSSPQVLSAPAAVAPQAPVPAPATGAGGSSSAAPTPQVATARSNDTAVSPTPGLLSAGAGRPSNTPSIEAFNPAANPPQSTPLVSRPPLQSTSASAKDSGISLLRILEIVAATCFVLSAGAFLWDKKRP